MKPYVLIGVLLGVAMLPFMPYGYYGIMRWIVCAACVYLALQAHAAGRMNWTWVWGVAAGIYNPIFRVTATREVWTIVNLITIAIVAYGAWQFTRRQ